MAGDLQHQIGNPLIQGGQRDQQAHRQDRARGGIADGRHRQQQARQPLARKPHTIDQKQRGRDRQAGGNAPRDQCIDQRPSQTG